MQARARRALVGARSRLLGEDRGLLVVLLVGIAAAVSAVSNYPQLTPDSQFYLGWTLRILGYSNPESAAMVQQVSASVGGWTPYENIWQVRTAVLGTRPRLIVPLLSAPLVAVFGLRAIAVVPTLAYLLGAVLTYRLARKHAGALGATAAGCVAALSPLVLRWSVAGLTDSTATAMHAGLLLLMPWAGRLSRGRLAGIVALAAATGAARPIAPFTLAAVVTLWVWAMVRGERAHRRVWTLAASGGVVGSVLATLWNVWAVDGLRTSEQVSALTGGRYDSYLEALPWYREVLPVELRGELLSLLRDPMLFTLIVAAALAAVVAWRTVVPWLLAGALAGAVGVFLLLPANTGFRYEMPMLPALVVGAAVLFDRLARVRGTHPVGARPEDPGPAAATGA